MKRILYSFILPKPPFQPLSIHHSVTQCCIPRTFELSRCHLSKAHFSHTSPLRCLWKPVREG